jgi:hypothetical protein
MQRPDSPRKFVIWVAAAAAALSSCTSGATSSGLVSLEATCEARGNKSGPHFRITIVNGTAQHLSIGLGSILGNGDRLAQALSLRLRQPGSTGEVTFSYADARHAGVAGRVDPWLIESLPGSRMVVEVAGEHFLSTGPHWRRFSFAERGEVKVVLRSLGSKPWPGPEVPTSWTGVVASPWLRFPDGCTPRIEGAERMRPRSEPPFDH